MGGAFDADAWEGFLSVEKTNWYRKSEKRKYEPEGNVGFSSVLTSGLSSCTDSTTSSKALLYTRIG